MTVQRAKQRLRNRLWPLIAASASALFTAYCVISALLFVFPKTDMSVHADAIVVLGGNGNRLGLGMRLARAGRAPYLVLSLGLPWLPPGICAQHVGASEVICYKPRPDTTQGEAEGAARLARRYGWRSMVLVTTQDQVWRAHLRFARCYPGHIYGIGVPLAWYQWPYAIGYQSAATVKAEIFQRGC